MRHLWTEVEMDAEVSKSAWSPNYLTLQGNECRISRSGQSVPRSNRAWHDVLEQKLYKDAGSPVRIKNQLRASIASLSKRIRMLTLPQCRKGESLLCRGSPDSFNGRQVGHFLLCATVRRERSA